MRRSPFLDFTPSVLCDVELPSVTDRVSAIVDEVAVELGIERGAIVQKQKGGISGGLGGGAKRTPVTDAKVEVFRRANRRFGLSQVEVSRELGITQSGLSRMAKGCL